MKPTTVKIFISLLVGALILVFVAAWNYRKELQNSVAKSKEKRSTYVIKAQVDNKNVTTGDSKTRPYGDNFEGPNRDILAGFKVFKQRPDDDNDRSYVIKSRLLPFEHTTGIMIEGPGAIEVDGAEYSSHRSSAYSVLYHARNEVTDKRSYSLVLSIDKDLALEKDSSTGEQTVNETNETRESNLIGFHMPKGSLTILGPEPMAFWEKKLEDGDNTYSRDIKLYRDVDTSKTLFYTYTFTDCSLDYHTVESSESTPRLYSIDSSISYENYNEWQNPYEEINMRTFNEDHVFHGTIWIDSSVWKQIEKTGNKTLNKVEKAFSGTIKVSKELVNDVGGLLSSASCAGCESIMVPAIDQAIKNYKSAKDIGDGEGGAAVDVMIDNAFIVPFCTWLFSSAQLFTIPAIPWCPECEAVPVSTAGICGVVMNAFVGRVLDKATENEVMESFCEKIHMCPSGGG